MKRPMLVSGIAIGLSALFLILAGIGALPILLLGAVSVFVLYFIKPLKLKEKIIIPTVCISVFLSGIFFGVYHFTKIVPATRLDNTVADISGKIITTPQEFSYGTKFILKTDKIGNKSEAVKVQVFLSSEYEDTFGLYDYVTLPQTKLTVIRDEYNKPDAEAIGDNILLEAEATTVNILWESEETPYYYCLRLKEIITEQINSYLQPYDAGFLLGMLFGDKTSLDADIKNDFRATGIAHLLAVSGLHTGVWCAYIISFLKLFKMKERLRNIFCLLFLVLLCIVSAFTPSVMRASIMMAVMLFAPFFKDEQDALNSLGFAVAILILHNPYIVTSVSFLLSVFATLGVLMSLRAYPLIYKLTQKIKPKIIKAFAEYLSSNIVTSALAGIFTLPVTAYFFRTFGIVSPIANILCVKPAFWGMLSGTISTLISFIPVDLLHTIAIYLFKITQILLRFVTGVADFIAEFRFCSLPVHKEYFILGIIIILFIIGIAFIFGKTKANKKLISLTAIICSVVLILSIALPCTKLLPSTLTVLNVGNGLNVSLRSGLYYGFLNCGTSADEIPYASLPAATSERLDFVFISAYSTQANAITNGLINSSPHVTVITEYIKEVFNEGGISLPDNTVISNEHSESLNNEIKVTTIDTYRMGCAIIESSKKSVYLCYGTQTDFNMLFDTYGVPDTLVLSGYIPDTLPQAVDTLIISSGSEIIINKNLPALKNQCNKFYTTAENGNIKLFL